VKRAAPWFPPNSEATWDSPEASVGNTVYFPVNVKGGLFYIGDGHAAMGDGEIGRHGDRGSPEGARAIERHQRPHHRVAPI